LALLGVAAIGFSACSGAATQAPAPAASAAASAAAPASAAASAVAPASAAAAGTPVNGGTLVVGLPGDMAFADPSLVSDGNSLYVMNQVVQGLVGLAPGTLSDIVPVLAASLPTVSPDGLTYTFTLRTGIKFQDGTPFNAAAVKYNYDRWKNFPKGDLQNNAYYYGAVFGGFGSASNIVSVDAPNDTTVIFHLKQPQSNFLISQTLMVFGIQSPTALQKGNADATPLSSNKYAQGELPEGQDMVGTGPFTFKEWVPKDHITVVKNANYWDPANAAHVDQIVFKPIGDSTARLQALQSGSIDIAVTIQPTDVKTAQSSGLTVIDRGQQTCNMLMLDLNQQVNGKPTIYANKDVRLAIASALNKPAYLSAFFGGQGLVPTSFLPVGTLGYKAENLPGYDPAKAKSLLQQSGVPASQLKVDLYYPSNVTRPYMPDPKDEAEAIASDLQAVGFTINLKTEDWGTSYVSDATNGKLPMYMFGWICDWAGADDYLSVAWFGYINGQPNPQFHYANATLNEDMQKALAAPTADQANQYWGQAQDILAADMPAVPLSTAKVPGAYDSKVHGFVPQGGVMEYLNSVWLQ
jgi:peptide/nickel transport system substrate-binding protein